MENLPQELFFSKSLSPKILRTQDLKNTTYILTKVIHHNAN